MSFTKALGKIPSGIFVVTAKKGEAATALLASWIQQASFDPPTLSVAVHKDRPMNEFLTEHAHFAIHILSDDNKDMYKKFVKGVPPNIDPFQDVKTKEGKLGTIILEDVMAVLECRVRGRVDAGDHHLILADVLDGEELQEGASWVHIRKSGLSY